MKNWDLLNELLRLPEEEENTFFFFPTGILISLGTGTMLEGGLIDHLIISEWALHSY